MIGKTKHNGKANLSTGIANKWGSQVFSPAGVQRPARRGLMVLLLLVLMAILALAPIFPYRVTPASAPDEMFSGERAMTHLPFIAREPHPTGSIGQAQVRAYLVQQLSVLGLQPEVQETRGIANVVARLEGTDPSGAIVVLAHYDSSRVGPGAADNGSGVAALLEIMRALASGPALRNDVIALFDDSEELPDPFTGTKAFVREHPWMADVRVAISLDTASRGFVAVCEIGPENGWMVDVLAHAYTGGAWYSISGGGNYDSTPFRDAGIQVLALEDNYPFKEKETAMDVVEVVRPALVQQMGEQTLAIVGELGVRDLGNTRGEQETYFTLPLLGFVHYPQAWVLPLAITAGVLLVLALGLALRKKAASWRGLGVAFAALLVTGALSAAGINALWMRMPELMGWETSLWPDWPEVIPPYGEVIFAVSGLLVLGLVVGVYILARRWSSRTDFSLIGLLPFLLLAAALGVSIPRAAFVFTWPVLLGALGWIVAATAGGESEPWSVDLAALLTAVLLVLMFMPTLVGTFMSDGTKSVAILAAVWALMLGGVLPAVDGLLVHTLRANK